MLFCGKEGRGFQNPGSLFNRNFPVGLALKSSFVFVFYECYQPAIRPGSSFMQGDFLSKRQRITETSLAGIAYHFHCRPVIHKSPTDPDHSAKPEAKKIEDGIAGEFKAIVNYGGHWPHPARTGKRSHRRPAPAGSGKKGSIQQ